MHRRASYLMMALGLLASLGRAQRAVAPNAVAPNAVAPTAAVRDAIASAVAYLERQQHEDGTWIYKQSPFMRRPGGAWHGSSFDGGLTALAMFALASSGVPGDKPAIRKGLAWCEQHPEPFATGSRSTYSASLLVLALCRIDAAKHKKWIHALASRIASSQLETGLWSYELVGKKAARKRGASPWAWLKNGDGSNTQFAVLALWTAQATAGYRVPSRVWKKVRDYHQRTQHDSGGWSYKAPRKKDKDKGRRTPRRFGPGTSAPAWMYEPSPAMTAAGVFAHTCAAAGLSGGARGLAKARKSKVVAKGLTAFRADGERWDSLFDDYYFAYSVERVGSLHELPDADWYAALAKNLLERQGRDGRWRQTAHKQGFGYGDQHQVYETSLALLCLSRASRHPITPGKRK